jgi:hypothetical protein
MLNIENPMLWFSTFDAEMFNHNATRGSVVNIRAYNTNIDLV